MTKPLTQDKAPRPDQRILEILSAADKPLSAYALLDRLRRFGVRSPPIVYRALAKLSGRGLIHRIESVGGFIACRHKGHTHETENGMVPFIICKKCGDVNEIADAALAGAMQKLAGKFLAETETQIVEMSGTCHACSSVKGRKRKCST